MNPHCRLNGFFYYMLEHEFGDNRREIALQLRVPPFAYCQILQSEEFKT